MQAELFQLASTKLSHHMRRLCYIFTCYLLRSMPTALDNLLRYSTRYSTIRHGDTYSIGHIQNEKRECHSVDVFRLRNIVYFEYMGHEHVNRRSYSKSLRTFILYLRPTCWLKWKPKPFLSRCQSTMNKDIAARATAAEMTTKIYRPGNV